MKPNFSFGTSKLKPKSELSLFLGTMLWEECNVFFTNKDLKLKPIQTHFKWQKSNKCGFRKIENGLLRNYSVLKDCLCVSR